MIPHTRDHPPRSPRTTLGQFATVQACSKPNDPNQYAVKHINKERLIFPADIKRSLELLKRVGAEIQAMRSLKSE